jgi:transcription elongation factor GreA
MPPDVHITPEGLVEVKRELEELVNNRRPYIAEKIKTAREFGDLSENFEYHSAKNEQGFIEARIQELDAIVKNAVLIEAPAATGKVAVGNTVGFIEDGTDLEESYRIVGPAEADPTAGRVSYESAIGRALIGSRVGDVVEVETPAGSYSIRVTAIS